MSSSDFIKSSDISDVSHNLVARCGSSNNLPAQSPPPILDSDKKEITNSIFNRLLGKEQEQTYVKFKTIERIDDTEMRKAMFDERASRRKTLTVLMKQLTTKHSKKDK